MDEKLHNDINTILNELAFMTNDAQASDQGRETAGEETVLPGKQPRVQQQPPPPQPVIVYLVDTPPPEAYQDYDQDYDGDTVDSLLETDAEAPTTADDENGGRKGPRPIRQEDGPHGTTIKPRQKNKRGILVGALCVVLAGAALTVSLLSPLTGSATVTILPQSREISATTTFTVVTGGLAHPARHEVAGRVLSSLTLSQARTVPTTGTGHQDAQAGHGMVTFYNASLALQTVSAGTVLVGSDGIEVLTGQDAVIPAGSLSINGQVTVPAQAVIAGPGGNIRAGDIYGPCCRLNVFVENSQAFQGGQNARRFPMVTRADMNGVVAALKTNLEESVQAALAVQVHSDESQLPPLCTPTVTANHAVGDEANFLSVTMDETCTGIAYPTQALHTLVTQIVTAQAIRQWGIGYALAGSIQVTMVKSSTSDRQKQGSLTLQVKGVGVWAYQFTNAELQHLTMLIAGKSTREARTILLGVPGVQSVTIQLDGGWGTSTTLPGNPGQIKMGELLGFGQ